MDLPSLYTPSDSYDAPSGPLWLQEKQGTTFRGFGDSRQTVIVMSIFSICVTTPILVTTLAMDIYISLDSVFSTFLAVLPFIASFFSLIGAVKFNIHLVAVNVLWHICT